MRKLKVGLAVLVSGGFFATPAHATEFKIDTADTAFTDDGQCGLREAVEAARTNQKQFGCAKGQSKRDVILLKGQTYQLGFTTTNEAANANGDLDVTGGGPLSIRGKGSDATDIRQNAMDRVFDLPGQDSNLTLEKLSVSAGDVTSLGGGGNSFGGNIRAFGTNAKLSLKSVEVTSGSAVIGGGLASAGNSKVKTKGTVFDSNDATVGGGGAAVTSGSSATFANSLFQQNDATATTNGARGGGLLVESTAKVVGSTLQANGAEGTGPGISANGAGIHSIGTLTVVRSLIRGNSTSANNDNTQENGGGIYVGGGEAVVTNSTIHNNQAGEVGDNDGLGGAFFLNNGTGTLHFSTLDSNSASLPGGGNQLYEAGGTLSYGESILAGSDPCGGLAAGSLGYSAIEASDVQCAASDDDVVPADLFTGLIGDNGGPTETISINPNSDAVNLIPKKRCKADSDGVDQRGYLRPAGKKCDAGAYELGAKKKKKTK